MPTATTHLNTLTPVRLPVKSKKLLELLCYHDNKSKERDRKNTSYRFDRTNNIDLDHLYLAVIETHNTTSVPPDPEFHVDHLNPEEEKCIRHHIKAID